MGVEGGSGLIDTDGIIQKECDQYISNHPSASFQEVQEKILYKYQQRTIYTAISPRVFEAAILKTCQILTRGDYSGVIKPDIHYIPINPDFSDYKETIEKFKDTIFRNQIIENAFNDICISDKWKYSTFVKDFDKHLEKSAVAKNVLSGNQKLHIFVIKNRYRSFFLEFRYRVFNPKFYTPIISILKRSKISYYVFKKFKRILLIILKRKVS